MSVPIRDNFCVMLRFPKSKFYNWVTLSGRLRYSIDPSTNCAMAWVISPRNCLMIIIPTPALTVRPSVKAAEALDRSCTILPHVLLLINSSNTVNLFLFWIRNRCIMQFLTASFFCGWRLCGQGFLLPERFPSLSSSLPPPPPRLSLLPHSSSSLPLHPSSTELSLRLDLPFQWDCDLSW